ncbi:glycosyltransferase involved in cell wall biosynthesis [Paenibacillus cellulosilyticus]|uniref:Glycosyltransferase involved in cell wall biosynthesis n=1 Tax=Paenibacillus cellulosilyticus TaxID=375489 RepID=A0A2V2Z3V6_9BACL|nr:glycosyltransferase family 2 protein [Paenibacillus cellulosilyticus]PWW08500.1 glycosyltransferase involved in cell wall biosynthesis [Paenibacillus cellulosilyticus]QKS48082.1 glycosyltransferase [Paenibacillus cellulosilyticus]
MLLGVHLIVRNEELHLARCLDSIRSWADELVVVDTGSTDQTVQIAASRGAHVVHAAWADDFAQTRNIGIGQARTLWILVLDADERLAEDTDMQQLRNTLLHSKETAYRVVIENEFGHMAGQNIRNEAVRLFRADLGYRYIGAIHEQLVAGEPGTWRDVDGPLSGVRLVHDGYEPGELARKQTAKRNERMIRKQLDKQPDSPFHWYNLGVTLIQQSKAAEASAAFARARATAAPDVPFRPSLMLDSARLMLALDEEESALELLARETERYPDYADLQLLYGECLYRQGAWLEAKQAHLAAIEAGQANTGQYLTEEGAASYKACTALAGLERRLGNRQEAARRYEQALVAMPGWPQALEGLAELLHEAGGSDGAIAQTLISYAGIETEGNYALGKTGRIGERLCSLAHALTLIGAYSSAVPLWRRVTADYPGAAAAPAAIASFSVCLIRTGQYAEAGELLVDPAGRSEPISMEAGIDWSLCCWMEGRRLPPASERLLDHSTLQLCQAAEKRLLGHRYATGDRTAEEGSVEAADRAEMIMDRAVSHGLLRIGERLAVSEERFAASLHRHGYTKAAADRLLRIMGTNQLGVLGLRTLGEMLYGRRLYSEALSLYERAVQHESDDERARLGAAAASLRLAAQALMEREEERSAAAWLTEERKRIEMAAIRLEGLGWRTTRNGAQRRRMGDGGAAEADFLMHDREG